MTSTDITRHLDPATNGGRPTYNFQGINFSSRREAIAYRDSLADEDPTLGMPGGAHDPDAINCCCDTCYA